MKRKALLRFSLTICTIGALVAVSVGPVGSQPADGDGAVSESDNPTTLQEFADRADAIQAVSEHPALKGRLGQVSLGADQKALEVRIVDLQDSDRLLAEQLGSESGIEIITVPAAISEAESASIATQAVAALQEGGLQQVDWAVGPEVNGLVTVVIGEEHLDRARQLVEQRTDESISALALADRARSAREAADPASLEAGTAEAQWMELGYSLDTMEASGSPLLFLVGSVGDTDVRNNTPVQAGKWFRFDHSGGAHLCTAGFTLISAGGYERATSAGHCWRRSHKGWSTTNGDSGITTDSGFAVQMAKANGSATIYPVSNDVTKNTLWNNNNTDVMVFKQNLVTASPKSRARISRDGTGANHVKVKGKLANGLQTTTQAVCMTGWGLQLNTTVDNFCDVIAHLNLAITVNGITITGLKCTLEPVTNANKRIHGGDSGGPVWSWTTGGGLAAGWIKGYKVVDAGPGEPDLYYSCWSTTDNVLADTGLTLDTE